MLELAQVERQRRRREREPLADLPRGKPLRSGLHEQPENIEPSFVTERNEGGYGFLLFHISNMMELFAESSQSKTCRSSEAQENVTSSLHSMSSDFDGRNDDGGQRQEEIALRDAEQPPDMPPGRAVLPAIIEFFKIAPCQLPFVWSQI